MTKHLTRTARVGRPLNLMSKDWRTNLKVVFDCEFPEFGVDLYINDEHRGGSMGVGLDKDEIIKLRDELNEIIAVMGDTRR